MTRIRFASAILTVAILVGCDGEARRRSDEAATGEAPGGESRATVAESAGTADEAMAEGQADMSGEEEETPGPRSAAPGVMGRAMIGPGCPVVEVGVECPGRPYATTLVIRDAESGRVVATVRSDEDGRFQAELTPGEYLLEGEPSELIHAPKAEPVRFEVTPGQLTEVIIHFDSGIR
ncbi:MAG: hypothetical protein GWN99_10545 [Gemmatimonadetes bacterium]|uniref:Carboxypeptidase regulatory-like domain-containing protein n=1 Tax=Candidatus Kutchimonas denitrificans TaxID=3056748 RepID=A0AAE4Z7N7_9BACT|nr:hypothetical protein [Gemmatimonadota bacterium]NIR74734.1 hypothetical protein [Candidatus Kutchimonas denitrificans]NIS01484.1 hypothetical protein [Gemmatimonadota bacterium]NIT67225.1 hypothetical protein [Gemmatimonadota bacterium]NIU52399.1 hypothetical protein [Gemmatimonadota bacterium]